MTSHEPHIDPNAIAAQLIQTNIDNLRHIAHELWRDNIDKVRLQLATTYANYISTATDQYSRAKSFLFRNTPVPLYQFYVPLGLYLNQSRFDEITYHRLYSLHRTCVITGVAGSGKSMLLRHLFLSCAASAHSVPVFIELRRLYDDDTSLYDLICQSLFECGFDLDATYVEKALHYGHFSFFLDGFDEIPSTRREAAAQEITRLATRTPNCFFVTSRPDDQFSGWDNFLTLSVQPLSLEDACTLVAHLPYDYEITERFQNDLRNGLFERHQSFLSNPLLLSIMLLTYSEYAEIPHKLSVFYDQAYQALFQRHDSLKGSFVRERKTDLDIKDFARAFSAFSLQTYDRNMLRFTTTDAHKLLEEAKSTIGMDFGTTEFLDDCKRAVCLLVEDGLELVFSHRSFQEYFVAQFILESVTETRKQLLSRYRSNMRFDSVFHLVHEMNPRIIEHEFLLPELESIFSRLKVKRSIGITHYKRYIKEAYSRFRITEDTITALSRANDSTISTIITFTVRRRAPGAFQELLERHGDPISEVCRIYGSDTEPYSIETKHLSTQSDFLRLMASDGGAFSKEMLQLAWNEYNAIKTEHDHASENLNKLLGGDA